MATKKQTVTSRIFYASKILNIKLQQKNLKLYLSHRCSKNVPNLRRLYATSISWLIKKQSSVKASASDFIHNHLVQLSIRSINLRKAINLKSKFQLKKKCRLSLRIFFNITIPKLKGTIKKHWIFANIIINQ